MIEFDWKKRPNFLEIEIFLKKIEKESYCSSSKNSEFITINS